MITISEIDDFEDGFAAAYPRTFDTNPEHSIIRGLCAAARVGVATATATTVQVVGVATTAVAVTTIAATTTEQIADWRRGGDVTGNVAVTDEDAIEAAEWHACSSGTSTPQSVRDKMLAICADNRRLRMLHFNAALADDRVAAEERAGQHATDLAYDERNRVVAAMAKMGVALGWTCGIGRHAAHEEWDPEWLNIVYIETPAGQASWHIHDRDLPLFAGLPRYEKPWDGHTTDEKYKRLEMLRASPGAIGAVPVGDEDPATVIEPMPVATDRTPSWERLIAYTKWKAPRATVLLADMAERDRFGRAKYGVPLTSGNGRNHLIDAYQELLDFAVYLTNDLDELGHPPVPFSVQQTWDATRALNPMPDDVFNLHELLRETIFHLAALRLLIDRRAAHAAEIKAVT